MLTTSVETFVDLFLQFPIQNDLEVTVRVIAFDLKRIIESATRLSTYKTWVWDLVASAPSTFPGLGKGFDTFFTAISTIHFRIHTFPTLPSGLFALITPLRIIAGVFLIVVFLPVTVVTISRGLRDTLILDMMVRVIAFSLISALATFVAILALILLEAFERTDLMMALAIRRGP